MTPLKIFVPTLAIAAVASVALAGSHGGDVPASVKTRKAHMALYSHNLGILFKMVKGETEYDAESAKAAAQNLVALSSLNQSGYWEPGTDSDSVEASRALPALWENIPDAIEKGKELNMAAMALADTAGCGSLPDETRSDFRRRDCRDRP